MTGFRSHWRGSLVLALAFAGCSHAPPSLPPMLLASHVLRTGSVLSSGVVSPRPEVADPIAMYGWLEVHVADAPPELWAADAPPSPLVVFDGSAEPVGAVARRLVGLRIGRMDPSLETTVPGRPGVVFRLALEPDTTQWLRLYSAHPEDAGVELSIALGLDAASERLDLGIQLESPVDDGDTTAMDALMPDESTQELVVVAQHALPAEVPHFLSLPSPFHEVGPHLLLRLHLNPGATSHPAFVPRAQKPRPLTLPQQWRQAFRRLNEAEAARRAWLFFAGELDVPVVEDLSWNVGDAELIAAGAVVHARVAQLPSAPDRAALGWELQRALLEVALTPLENGEEGMEGREAVLLRMAGEPGHYPGFLRSLLGLPDIAAFHRRLVEENRVFLDDRSPAARARAVRWLRAQGDALEGYDPFADRKARRAVLRAMQEEPDS